MDFTDFLNSIGIGNPNTPIPTADNGGIVQPPGPTSSDSPDIDPTIQKIFYPDGQAPSNPDLPSSTPQQSLPSGTQNPSAPLPQVNVNSAPSVASVPDQDNNVAPVQAAASALPQQVPANPSSASGNNPINNALNTAFSNPNPAHVNPISDLANVFNLKEGYTAGQQAQEKGQTDQAERLALADPTSPISQIAQSALQKALPNANIDFSKISAQQAMTIAPNIVTPIVNMQGKQLMMQNTNENQAIRQYQTQIKNSPGLVNIENANARINNLGQLFQVDPNTGAVTLPGGKIGSTLASGDLATIISGGHAAEAERVGLLPASFHGTTQDMANYFSGKLDQPLTQDQVKFLYDTYQREKNSNLQNEQGLYKKALSDNYYNLSRTAPDFLKNEEQRLGLSDSDLQSTVGHGTTSGMSNQTQQSSTQGGTVNVVTPDGKSWTIPSQNLQQAISRGAKQVS